ncbi:type II toxin-antitoxin system HicB family antitoxin [Anaerophaga thermohalophila]|jgi:predicted HicB family RNase H-like nuclease|uniref:type II toxin-antitoxin system HicB family antitoxin n=1 Tax=Anaerophaga thermohalophila TaxID=177400 RepID=UPI0002DE07EC|nr:type II toxin-antitoxin system HicB family antitoxin [Anaerophaga thermohalophila]
MKHLEYKGYTGSIEYSKEDDLLYGKVLGIKGLISYEGKTGKELEEDFREAINIYLADCESQGITPEKPFKGNFNVRISSELHQKAALLAMEDKMSLNNFVAESIRERVFKESSARKKSHRTSR